MELRRLRLLHELFRLGTVAAVADALSYSPSSVSVQLARLEREAGVPLLRRAGRNVELTAAGRRLVVHAAEALAADEAVRAELARVTDAPRGRVRVTFVQTPALALLPGTLERLARDAPDLRVEIVQRETAPATAELRSRAVDLVVGIEYDPVPAPRHRDVDRRDVLREDVVLVLRPDHPLATAGPVRIADCEHLPWATGHKPTSGLDAVLRNVCNRLGGFEPEILHRSDDSLLLGALVTSGGAIALLPALVVPALPGLVARHLAEERLQRTIFTATRTTATEAPAVAAVRRALRETATEVAAVRTEVELVG